jgi:cell division protein FtsL
MKHIKSILIGLFLATSIGVTDACAQSDKPSPPAKLPVSCTQVAQTDWDVEKILKSKCLDNPKLYVVLLVILIAGGFGGIVFELLNLQGNIERPHAPTEDELAAELAYASPLNVIDLGIFARIIIGACAAVPAMAWLEPNSVLFLLAMSLVTGSAGTAVFRSFQDRLLIAITQQEAIEKKIKIQQKNNDAKVDKAIAAVETLQEEVETKSESPEGINALIIPQGTVLNRSRFGEVRKVLSQVTGVNAEANKAFAAFKKLEEEFIKNSDKPQGTIDLKFTKNTPIDSNLFGNVKDCLSQAKRANELTVIADNSKSSQPAIPDPKPPVNDRKPDRT